MFSNGITPLEIFGKMLAAYEREYRYNQWPLLRMTLMFQNYAIVILILQQKEKYLGGWVVAASILDPPPDSSVVPIDRGSFRMPFRDKLRAVPFNLEVGKYQEP